MDINVSHPRFEDISGKKFGRLTAIKIVGKGKGGYRWLFRCDCANETVVPRNKVQSGHTRSCGCLIDEGRRERAIHGMTDSAEHRAWADMKRRCLNEKDKRYKYYGGRGIRICTEWVDDFKAFYGYLGPRPTPQHSVDRIDNNGNYEPGNVRWADKQTQSSNRRNVTFVEIDGITLNVRQWALKLGINYKVASGRIKRGWEPKAAILEGLKYIRH